MIFYPSGWGPLVPEVWGLRPDLQILSFRKKEKRVFTTNLFADLASMSWKSAVSAFPQWPSWTHRSCLRWTFLEHIPLPQNTSFLGTDMRRTNSSPYDSEPLRNESSADLKRKCRHLLGKRLFFGSPQRPLTRYRYLLWLYGRFVPIGDVV